MPTDLKSECVRVHYGQACTGYLQATETDKLIIKGMANLHIKPGDNAKYYLTEIKTSSGITGLVTPENQLNRTRISLANFGTTFSRTTSTKGRMNPAISGLSFGEKGRNCVRPLAPTHSSTLFTVLPLLSKKFGNLGSIFTPKMAIF